jgi:hypothetical protein
MTIQHQTVTGPDLLRSDAVVADDGLSLGPPSWLTACGAQSLGIGKENISYIILNQIFHIRPSCTL